MATCTLMKISQGGDIQMDVTVYAKTDDELSRVLMRINNGSLIITREVDDWLCNVVELRYAEDQRLLCMMQLKDSNGIENDRYYMVDSDDADNKGKVMVEPLDDEAVGMTVGMDPIEIFEMWINGRRNENGNSR